MPLSLEGIEEELDQVIVKWGDDALTVEYRPGRLDWGMFEQLAGLGALARTDTGDEGRHAMQRIRELLADPQTVDGRVMPPILAGWDLTEDKAGTRPVTISSAALARLAFDLVLEIMGAIMEEAQGKARQRTSPTGGLQRVPPASAQAG